MAPNQIILDMDVTNDEIYGNQEQGFFNAYYGQSCYAPLLIFWGHRLLAARLRPSNVDPAAGALEELQRLIPQIQIFSDYYAETVHPLTSQNSSRKGKTGICSLCRMVADEREEKFSTLKRYTPKSSTKFSTLKRYTLVR